MAKRQGFYNNNNKPFVYQELDGGSSFAMGIDSADSNIVKLQASTTANIAPFGTAQIKIDPSANGPVTVDPNGTGALVLASGNFQLNNTAASGLDGEIQFGGVRWISNYTTASENTFVGANSGNTTLTTADNNTCLGRNTGNDLTTGSSNTLVGDLAGQSITGGAGNTAVGLQALSNFTQGVTSLGSNVAIGSSSLGGLLTGARNTAVGVLSASAVTSGDYNTIVGYNAGSSVTGSSSSNILIQNAGGAESNTMRLGTTGAGVSQVNRCFMAGVDGVNVGSVAKVLTMASEQVGTATITAGTGISVTPGANTITIAQTTAPAAAVNFDAFNTATDSNVIGDDTLYTVICNSAITNVGSAYNTGTGIFTAPNTGLYYFSGGVTTGPYDGTFSYVQAYLNRNNGSKFYSIGLINAGVSFVSGDDTIFVGGSIVLQLTAGDTMRLSVGAGSSTKTVGVIGNASTSSTYFQGYQIA